MPLLILLAWPLLEIAGFVLVGREIGVLATIGLILLSGVVGGVLLRVQGFGALRRIQAETEAGRDPGRDIAHGAMILLAGLLLMLPGFVSDILGLALFLPPVRDFAWRLLRDRITVSVARTGAGRRGGPTIIDLDPEDYESTNNAGVLKSGPPNANSPWRGPGRDRDAE